MAPEDTLVSRWRSLLTTFCFLGYCTYYLTRKSCTYSLPLLLDDDSLSMTKQTAGMIFSAQMVGYSIGKFVCGILSDQYSCRMIFSLGLFLSGICNFLFAMCSQNYQFALLWAANGIFQGCGWAPIAILLKRWYKPTEIGKIWSFMSITMNVSSSCIPFLMAELSTTFDWRTSYFMIALFSCGFSFFSFIFIKDSPEDVVSTKKTIVSSESKSAPKKNQISSIDYFAILQSPFLCCVSLSYFLWTGVKQGVEDWLLVYVTRERSLTTYEGSFCIMCFQIGGLLACLGTGVVSDALMAKYQSKTRSSPRLPVVIFCSTFFLLWLYLLQASFITNPFFINVTCFFLGLASYGPHSLYGLLVIENSPEGFSGTAHGIAATASTLGGIFSGYPLSVLIEAYHWGFSFCVLGVVAVINTSVLLLCTTFQCKIESSKKQQ